MGANRGAQRASRGQRFLLNEELHHCDTANRMSVSVTSESLLGSYLRDRRTRLDPAAFGLSGKRRRTPGLRREEVAQRANISPTWYTWLEQGRGGAPSADVLDRIARALILTEVEREHLYLLGLGRPPEIRYTAPEGAQVADLVDELCRLSPEFEALWRDQDVRSFGEGVKHLKHPVMGSITIEYSSFAVDGRPDLSMLIYNPVTPEDAARIRSLMSSREPVGLA